METSKQKVPTLSVECADAAEDLEKKTKEKESKNQETSMLDVKAGLTNGVSEKMRQESRNFVTDGLCSGSYGAIFKENNDQDRRERQRKDQNDQCFAREI